jgi:hypothetical protein
MTITSVKRQYTLSFMIHHTGKLRGHSMMASSQMRPCQHAYALKDAYKVPCLQNQLSGAIVLQISTNCKSRLAAFPLFRNMSQSDKLMRLCHFDIIEDERRFGKTISLEWVQASFE